MEAVMVMVGLVVDISKVPYSIWEILGFSQPLPFELIPMRPFLFLVLHMLTATVGTGQGCLGHVKRRSGVTVGICWVCLPPLPLDNTILVILWGPTVMH